MVEYILTLDKEQAKEIQNALEVIIRWKLKQPELMKDYLPDRLNWKRGVDFDISLSKRKAATELLRAANDLLVPYDYSNPSLDQPLKDEQWHRIYNIFQVIRHAIWESEESHAYWTVDSGDPFDSYGVGLPKIEWKKKDD